MSLLLKGSNPQVSSMVLAHKGSFENKFTGHICGTNVTGKTVRAKLRAGDTKERYWHLYFSRSKMAREQRALMDKLHEMQRQMQRMTGRACTFSGAYTHYFDCECSQKSGKSIFERAVPKSDVIDRELALCGYFCLISSEAMSAENAYWLYKGCRACGQLFGAKKIWSTRSTVPSVVQAQHFVDFLALIVRARLERQLGDHAKKWPMHKRYLTVSASIRELEKIELTRGDQQGYRALVACKWHASRREWNAQKRECSWLEKIFGLASSEAIFGRIPGQARRGV